MTFNIGHVEGGTNAGWKREKPRRTKTWRCECGKERSATWNNCPDCKGTNPHI